MHYFAVESAPWVTSAMYIESDGSDTPFRQLKLRTPSFSNLSSMP